MAHCVRYITFIWVNEWQMPVYDGYIVGAGGQFQTNGNKMNISNHEKSLRIQLCRTHNIHIT